MSTTANPPDTLGALLAAGRDLLRGHSDSASLDAELLLTRVTGASRATLYARPEKEVGPSDIVAYQHLIRARQAGQPVAYLTGEREFWSLAFEVNEHTLIPRPETEHLVEAALARIFDKAARILELGTGSGAVAAAIASERPDCEVIATDLYPDTLALAQKNLQRLGLSRVQLLQSDWFTSIPVQSKFDMIITNPPYVATGQSSLTGADIEWEPAAALFSGTEGLDAIRVIASQAPGYLNAGGWLILEHGFDQSAAVLALLEQHGFGEIELQKDLNGLPRISAGRLLNTHYE